MKDQINGCLLGGAVGDALGADIEFMSLPEIRHRFGAAGLADYVGACGQITDDTQMTLFTAEGLLSAGDRLTNIHRAYLRWYITQGGRPQLDVGPKTGLIAVAGMHQRRAPGNTCMSALNATRALGRLADNNSKGCGGVMRAAPVGLFAPTLGDNTKVFDLATAAAALTHGHPSGHLPAGFLAVMIAALSRGTSMLDAVVCAVEELLRHKGARETMRAVDAACDLASHGRPTPEGLEGLGGAWVGEEALAISICCALTATTFADGVLMAVNHSGDSDSTGAITGNLLGAQHGIDGIPRTWLERLELRDTIERVALGLQTYK
jgi:ADP-ribosyl-[dinitrogen reductase] hydrolase